MNYKEYNKVDEFIELFKQGKELYKKDPLFNKAAMMYASGESIYDIFEQIIITCGVTNKAFEQYITRDARPYFISTKE